MQRVPQSADRAGSSRSETAVLPDAWLWFTPLRHQAFLSCVRRSSSVFSSPPQEKASCLAGQAVTAVSIQNTGTAIDVRSRIIRFQTTWTSFAHTVGRRPPSVLTESSARTSSKMPRILQGRPCARHAGQPIFRKPPCTSSTARWETRPKRGWSCTAAS